eukprot:TRINITY_DN25783_c0_g1_i5.p1 TRINITY_DN25783_c0_g1~~TRINITY_DN25783_c0_g1_i5.p1  ORF type:complete len:273 (-),score=27.44 TRINITY_DN25783_c0_g1_i5:722-1540(-)
MMCKSALEGAKVAFSIGIDGRDGWGSQLSAEHHMHIRQFDCTGKQVQHTWLGGDNGGAKKPPCERHVGEAARYAGKCDTAFFPICIKPNRPEMIPKFAAPENFQTLREMVEAGAATDDNALTLKIDIEGGEWAVLEDIDPDLLKRFRTIAIEFHYLGPYRWRCFDPFPGVEEQARREHPRYLKAMQNLLQHFRVVHTHVDPFFPSAAYNSYRMAPILEALLMRKDWSNPAPCTSYRWLHEHEECNYYVNKDCDKGIKMLVLPGYLDILPHPV